MTRKRSPTVRVSDLDIRERAWPLIVAIDYNAICHISTHNGILRAGNQRHKNPRDEHYVVTKCGRALRFTTTRTHVPVERIDRCARCGSQADFEAIRAEYYLKQEEYNQEQARKDTAKSAARLLERDRRTAVMEALYQAFDCDNVVDMSWSPKPGETDRGQQVIYLQLDTQLPGVITVGERNHAYPHLYRAVVHLEPIPDDDE